MKYFTIVTKSYFGLALTLRESLISNSGIQDSDFYIFILDGDEDNTKNVVNVNTLLENHIFEALAFKYDVTEFATSVKPIIFKHLLNIDDDITYLDPDIYVFQKLYDFNYEKLYSDKLIHLTPHFLEIDLNKNDYNRYLGSGAYNLGFLRIRKNNKIEKFLDWWQSMCSTMCFRDRNDHLFTDQKWFDLIFCFFESQEINIIRDYSFNVAPWNHHERKIVFEKEKFYVQTRSKLETIRFYHFSGFDYRNLSDSSLENDKFKILSDVNLIRLTKFYGEKLNDQSVSKYLNKTYKFNSDKDQNQISLLQRRLFRVITNNIDFRDQKKINKIKNELRPFSLGINKYQERYNPEKNIKANQKKDLVIKLLFRVLLMIVGVKRYMDFLKYINYISLFENQVFLTKKYDR
jgi:hypothetical protein